MEPSPSLFSVIPFPLRSQARDCETSIEHDPDYAKAYARCCRVYIKLGCINRAREVVSGTFT